MLSQCSWHAFGSGNHLPMYLHALWKQILMWLVEADTIHVRRWKSNIHCSCERVFRRPVSPDAYCEWLHQESAFEAVLRDTLNWNHSDSIGLFPFSFLVKFWYTLVNKGCSDISVFVCRTLVMSWNGFVAAQAMILWRWRLKTEWLSWVHVMV